MDTFGEISCFSSDKKIALAAMKEAFKEMERIDRLFSKFDKKSEISNVNTLAGLKEVTISRELFEIIERAIYYSKISNGSFDITVEPLKEGRYRAVLLNRDRLSIRFLAEDIKIDLGGIAKGYAVDRAKEVLLSRGIENALVNIGGNIFAMGSPPGRKAWRIGIRDPKNKDDVVYKLNLVNRAVSTSGNYERHAHIINPVSGEAVEGAMSVTVIADSAEEADALSTTVFVMGIEKGLRFIKSIKGVELFIIDKDGRLIKCP